MFGTVNKWIALGSVCIPLLVASGYAHNATHHTTIAILPCYDMVMTFKKFHQLITYLEQQTDFDIEILVAKDFSEFERALKSGEIDFALQDPHTYVRLARLYNRDAVMRALTRDGRTSQCGAIIARKDSEVKDVRDLRGKTVMFGPKLSVTKWIAAKEVFEENGINIDRDLGAYYNGGCCEDIAFHVYLKSVHAGAVCDHFLEGHPENQKELGIDVKEITVIGRTKFVPTRVFAARKELNSEFVSKIIQTLLSLDRKNPEHSRILYPAELGGFQKAKDEDYDSVRALIKSEP